MDYESGRLLHPDVRLHHRLGRHPGSCRASRRQASSCHSGAPGWQGSPCSSIFRKDRLRITFFDRRAPASRYLFAALIPIGGAVLIYLIYRLFFAAPSAGTASATPWILLLWFPLGAIGEELGWRGYLHNRLNADMVGLVSSVIVGTLWAFWHVGSYQNRDALHPLLHAPDDFVHGCDLRLGVAYRLQCPGVTIST